MEFYDVRELDGYTTSITYDNGEVDEISENFFTGGAVRALAGGSFGFTSVDDVGRIEAAVADAVAIARRLDRLNPQPRIELAPIPKIKKDPYRVKKKPADVSLGDKQALMRAIEGALGGGLIRSTKAPTPSPIPTSFSGPPRATRRSSTSTGPALAVRPWRRTAATCRWAAAASSTWAATRCSTSATP